MEECGDVTQWWWGVASAAQLGWGVRSYAKGYAGDSRFMPLKAFAVASLFVGSAATASVLVLQANGIHKNDVRSLRLLLNWLFVLDDTKDGYDCCERSKIGNQIMMHFILHCLLFLILNMVLLLLA